MCSLRGLRERRDMTYYRQTYIIPTTKQRFPEPERPRRQSQRHVDSRNNINRDLNSILAFFD